MARPAIAEVRKLTDDQIVEQINGIRRELFDLRFQQATRRLENPHRFRESRIRLAHLQTVQRERQLSSAS
ncbi:MAG: 50S ribosomal protein L29 [Cyanobium sp.]